MAGISGSAVPLSYGYAWATGIKLQSATLNNTGDDNLDYTRIGMYLLGDGEWDGLIEMWDSGLGRLLFQSETDDTTKLHFHPGCDATAGSYEYSVGGDQGVDTFWQYLAPGLQPLHYNRWAYYALKIKQLINNPPNTNQNDETVWADVNPIGLWRTRRCRIFDATGAMTGYAFTRNPAWHYVDLICKRKLFPEYLIPNLGGAQDLPAAVRARFMWSALADSAAYYDELMDNGLPRFAGDYTITQKSSLQACLTQIATCSRSYSRERAGQFGLIADRPRASVFTFTRKTADSFTTNGSDLHSAANTYVAKYRDLQIPAFATIASISAPYQQKPTVTTAAPHSAVANDYVVINNTGTRFDGNWQVDSVPSGDSVYTMQLKNRGGNYPTAVGAGGLIGFRFSRFHDRLPQFQHKQHQLARGAVGVGIARQRNRVNVETDFANCTWDQAARVSEHQKLTALGPDVTPYVSPIRATLKTPFFAPDAAGSGAIAAQLEPGDIVTIDETLSDAYAGQYEIMKSDEEFTTSAPGQGMQRTAQPGGMTLTLRPYSAANAPDEVTSSEPGWPDVPGMPGNTSLATQIPLADGFAAFFSGSASDSDSFQMPDGFNSTYLLAWASPQGFIESDSHMHFIRDCDAYTNRKIAMVYDDSTQTYTGDANYSALTWRTQNSARLFSIQTVSFVELTLAGGELIVFGEGIVPSGTQVPLPDGYSATQCVALAFPKSASDSGNPAHGVAAWVDSGGILHHHYQDGEGNQWEGPGQTMIVAFRNNAGTWKQDSSGWWFCPLAGGKTLALVGLSLYPSATAPTVYPATRLTQVTTANAATNPAVPPLTGMSPASFQAMPGPNGFQIVDHPAHGVKQCYIDNTLTSFCVFGDGDGNAWTGSTGAFGLLCDTPTGPVGSAPTAVSGSPVAWPGTGTTGTGGSGGTGGGGGGGGTPPGGGSPTTPVQSSPYTVTDRSAPDYD